MKINVVLVYPQIPPNTGSIARTCAATGAFLHLVKPLGFEVSDNRLRRAGIDYWTHVNILIHESWEHFLDYRKAQEGRLVSFSPAGVVNCFKFKFQEGDYLVHGREADGLPQSILSQSDCILHVPMFSPAVRSLNLASTATLTIYEAIRQVYLC